MHKNHFKIVSVIISLSLIIFMSMQIYWLTSMYSDMREKFEQKLDISIQKAFYNDLRYRIQSNIPKISNNKKTKDDTIYININAKVLDERNDTHKIEYIDTRNIKDKILINRINKKKSKYLKEEDVKYINSKLNSKKYRDSLSKNLNSILKKKFESKDKSISDNIISIFPEAASSVSIFILNAIKDNKYNLNKIDSLFTSYLEKNEIYLMHNISIVKDNKIKQNLGKNINNKIIFNKVIDEKLKLVCRIEIENPNYLFLNTMKWIFLSSLLILISLSISFIYLLKTIFKQKSIEEMRQDFTHNITHELKTPIATINAANDVLIDSIEKDNTKIKYRFHEAIRKELHNLSSMVEKILSLSVQENSEFRLSYSIFNIEEIIKEIIDSTSIKCDKDVKFNLEISDSEVDIRADKFHFKNIISTIIDNSIKYSKDNTTVNIFVNSNSFYHIISIEDNGIGISKNHIKRIFDKFYRIPTGNIHNIKGFGLGLYYTKLIVEKHKGSIEVDSILGKGSKFIIKFPKNEE